MSSTASISIPLSLITIVIGLIKLENTPYNNFFIIFLLLTILSSYYMIMNKDKIDETDELITGKRYYGYGRGTGVSSAAVLVSLFVILMTVITSINIQTMYKTDKASFIITLVLLLLIYCIPVYRNKTS
jgi:uncharacterized membrane protein YfcA